MTVKQQDIPELAEYPVVYSQVVAWGDMDALGHLNGVIYHRYVETARIDYYRHIGLHLGDMVTVVTQNSCRYLHSVIFPDTLYIGVRIEEVRNTSFRMHYVLYSKQQQKVVAHADAVIVLVDETLTQKCAIPDSLREQIVTFEASVGHTINTLTS